MITNMKKIVSADLFAENESLLFDKERAALCVASIPSLGAITFAATRSKELNDLAILASTCATEAISLVNSTAYCAGYRTWLFVADSSWQPATAMVNYRKLWKNHRELVDTSGVQSIGEEVEFTSEDGIRFAGLLEVDGDALLKAVELLRTNPACAIVFSQRQDIDSHMSVESIFSSAFPKTNGIEQLRIDWMTLALNLCPKGDILLRVSGLFDDNEAASDLIATPDIILNFTEEAQQ